MTSGRVNAALRELAVAIAAAEDAPLRRSVLLDRLFALHRPSLHGGWQEHWCALCEPPEAADDAAPLEWLDPGARGVCIVCVRATPWMTMGADDIDAWPACQSHFPNEIRGAIARQQFLYKRLAARQRARLNFGLALRRAAEPWHPPGPV